MNLLAIAVRIASRLALDPPPPPPPAHGESITLLDYAGPIGPEEEIIEQNGKEYVVRQPMQEPAKSYEW